MRINNISVCWNKVTQESITHQYARMRSPEATVFQITWESTILQYAGIRPHENC